MVLVGDKKMKVLRLVKNLVLGLTIGVSLSNVSFGQEPIEGKVVIIKKSEQKPEVKTEPVVQPESKTEETPPPLKTEETAPPLNNTVVETKTVENEKPGEVTEENNPVNDDKKLSEEEAAVLPYLDNYLQEYRLGPTDVISIEVFGQPNYSKSGITVPPTARISYPLIREGVFVGGKTVEQIAEEITKKLDEYIIDPKVTVTLERANSARYSVFGKVSQPGVKVMDRRLSLYEAIVDAGSFSKDADKKRIAILRRSPQGGYSQTVYDMDLLLKGKTEMPYLLPGDQVVIPEKKWSLGKFLGILSQASAARILFGSPF